MRTFLILWTMAAAASGAPGVAPRRPAGPTESGRFASRLSQVIEQVVEQYYRPVTRERLYLAAAASLYQAAKRPIPIDLEGKLRAALSKERAPSEEEPRQQFLARTFEEAACYPAFTAQDPVLVACKAVARELDPHSGLVTAEEQRRAVGLDYESLGVGLELRASTNPGPLEIETVAYGGPAQRAGLRPGDRITRVNGVAAEKLTPELTLALGTERVRPGPAVLGVEEPASDLPRVLRIRYRRGTEKEERAALLYRDRFRPETVLGVVRNDGNTWVYLLDEKTRIAHVRLISLSRGSADELRTVLEQLLEHKARGLILDLRWCPGGYLNEAVDVADLFLGDAVIATVKMRGREDTVHRGHGKALCPDLPTVVLVNGDTSGGAELIAAALQDHGRAEVCGQRTRGKASVQTPLAVGLDGVGFKVTSGTFLRPSGKNLHRSPDSARGDDWGVLPLEDCRISPDLSRRFAEEWQRWSLRPASSLERLALDDPSYDTQRACAVRFLSARCKLSSHGK